MTDKNINLMIQEYIHHVYLCDGYSQTESDEFFEDMLDRYQVGYEQARVVVRRIEELGLGYFRDNALSLSSTGILLHEQYGNDLDKFLRRDQRRVDAEFKLPKSNLKQIWISIGISIFSLLISALTLFFSYFPSCCGH